jgi:hypothetical protein
LVLVDLHFRDLNYNVVRVRFVLPNMSVDGHNVTGSALTTTMTENGSGRHRNGRLSPSIIENNKYQPDGNESGPTVEGTRENGNAQDYEEEDLSPVKGQTGIRRQDEYEVDFS